MDKNYYEGLKDVKKAYCDMYPETEFLGEIEVKNIVDYNYEKSEKVCQLFSGGVDSVATFISIKNLNPDLVTVWGSDIDIENKSGWKKVENFIKKFGKDNNIKNVIIKSNFRKFIIEGKLNDDYQKKLKVNYWFGIQHGLALLSLVIPYAYKYKMKTIYIPSSFTNKDKNVRCASYPTIDESIKYGGDIIHEGFKYNRQDKLKIITKYLKDKNDKNIKLRVCWEGVSGENCSHCEKCLRTITGLYLLDTDPNKLGFKIEKNQIKDIIFSEKIILSNEFWQYLKNSANKNREKFKNEDWINWLIDLDIEKYNIDMVNKRKNKNRIQKLKEKIKRHIKKYILKN